MQGFCKIHGVLVDRYLKLYLEILPKNLRIKNKKTCIVMKKIEYTLILLNFGSHCRPI